MTQKIEESKIIDIVISGKYQSGKTVASKKIAQLLAMDGYAVRIREKLAVDSPIEPNGYGVRIITKELPEYAMTMQENRQLNPVEVTQIIVIGEEMEERTAKRTGFRSLSFLGEMMGKASGQDLAASDLNRWHEITLWRTNTESMVLEIQYKSTWQGEHDHYTSIVEMTENDVVNEIEMYDPVEHLAGYPDSERFSEKQAALVCQLKTQWAFLVSEFFESANLTETVA